MTASVALSVSPTSKDGRSRECAVGKGIDTAERQGSLRCRRSRHGSRKYGEPVKAQKSEMTGCFGHGSPEYHQRVAKEFETFIKPKLGW